ncbi:glycosyltransferase family 2 protein [Kineosporia sp. J2-2]|uniref:Glycosyltransferase family 2 protein n=1 Tax=Kineosporia corallincola TaxID=2835133 RepID=A0ABS5TPS1_9ACTN|nr:glycosyltransferase family 2 protein [Kineosporia corallincola]MBT0772048.1 glycosyltransferase family 2 protein [Kineosporia corallincola]
MLTDPGKDLTELHRVKRSRPARAVRDDIVLSIVMAAFNEGETIEAAVTHVLEASYPCPIELIVVDDGSADGTTARIAHIDDPRLKVFTHPRNMGKGAALMTGLAAATGTHLLPFDADQEYSAHDISRLLEPVIAGQSDVVYGTRLFGLNTVYHSFRYKMGNRATTLAANILFDSAVTDIHTCLKLVPTDLLRQFRLTEARFGLDTEITANVLRAGYRPFEVPVAYYARSHVEGKKINWKDGVRCLTVLARVRFFTTDPKMVLTGENAPTGHCLSCGHPLVETITPATELPRANGRKPRLADPEQGHVHGDIASTA